MKTASLRSALLVLGTVLAGCTAVGETGQGSPQAAEAAFDTAPDLPGSGAYPAMRDVRPDLPDHIVYRPRDLGMVEDRQLGVVLWGNGGCSADAASARFHLLEIASHGYVAIAPGKAFSGPDALPEPPREAPPSEGAFPPVQTLPADLLAGLDWILAENDDAQSPFHSLIDPEKVAVAGHSCGGLQAISVAADPRIATAIVHNSGVLDPAAFNPITGFSVAKAELANIHSPVLYILGGESDVAYPNGMDDFQRIDHVPVAVANLDVGHGGTFREPNGGRVGTVAVKWLEWQLRGDEAASRWFIGENCALCEDADWTYQAKGF
ncbi:hypothetical protein [Aurantiacibacter poecillastricola]|uniref:hypothetical protein n=1 Tax=Aurantiacibacter poecillastricola TaxID=3064385 RepID=UPI00273E68AA|nr:hypothetical protein [Aurantiacibacter sp. 219JJ12-13]MDP5263042.1 hypothetical protein [Aurantiacibacter sp. 219JJ12-13]